MGPPGPGLRLDEGELRHASAAAPRVDRHRRRRQGPAGVLEPRELDRLQRPTSTRSRCQRSGQQRGLDHRPQHDDGRGEGTHRRPAREGRRPALPLGQSRSPTGPGPPPTSATSSSTTSSGFRPDYPGAGNLTCFNNGLGRGIYSTADEFMPAVRQPRRLPDHRRVGVRPEGPHLDVPRRRVRPDVLRRTSRAPTACRTATPSSARATVGEFREVTTSGDGRLEVHLPGRRHRAAEAGHHAADDPARPRETDELRVPDLQVPADLRGVQRPHADAGRLRREVAR